MEEEARSRQVDGGREVDKQGQRQEEQQQQHVELAEEYCDGQLPSGAEAPSAEPDRELLTVRSVGVCYSVFANKRGVPRQGQLAPSK